MYIFCCILYYSMLQIRTIFILVGICSMETKILRAVDAQDPQRMMDLGFDIYCDVLNTIPKPFPVLILPKARDQFKIEETLLAVVQGSDKEEVVGIALLEEVVDIRTSSERFGTNAADILQNHLEAYGDGPVYKIGSIAVSPKTSGLGIGTEFYKTAAIISQSRCIATITQDNLTSQKTALKAGFVEVPGSNYKAKFSVKDGFPCMDPDGQHIIVAKMYAYGLKNA